MYRIYCDETLLYDPRVSELAILEPELTLELNTAGSFVCKLPPEHPALAAVVPMLSRVRVMQDGEELFKGRVLSMEADFFNRWTLTCEGELAFLRDSIQRPAVYHNATVRGYLETLVTCHNQQVEPEKQFEVGTVTVTDSNDSLYRYTNYNTTWEEVKADLTDDLGGCLRVRNVYDEAGELVHRYLDYINTEEYGVLSGQVILFGQNLVDFTRGMDLSEVVTVLIPLGAILEEQTEDAVEGLEERLTIKSVNDGLDYIEHTEAIAACGRLVRVVTWDGVTVAANLLKKAQTYLADEQYDAMTIEATALDLHLVEEEVAALRLGDRIRVVSAPHGLDKVFPLTGLKLCLDRPGENTLTLGGTAQQTLTGRTAALSSSLQATAQSVPSAGRLLAEAQENATALLTAASVGYVVQTAEELLVMDHPDKAVAERVWRWNVNGLGYSANGYDGDYTTAITMDGAIVADLITTGRLNCGKISFEGDYGGFKQAEGTADDETTIGVKMYGGDEEGYYIFVSSKGVRLTAGESRLVLVNGRIYSNREWNTTSDLRLKTDVREDLSRYEGFFRSLRPRAYRWRDQPEQGLHLGFLAQEVEQALHENGLTAEDFAALDRREVLLPDGSVAEEYSLSYQDFAALNCHMLQKLLKDKGD